MLISVAYLLIGITGWINERYRKMRFLQLVREHLTRASVVIDHRPMPQCTAALINGSRLLLSYKTVRLFLIEPKLAVSSRGQDSFKIDKLCDSGPMNFDMTSVGIVCEVGSVINQSDNSNLVQLTTLCRPITRNTSSNPLQLVVSCALTDLDRLVESFIDNRLVGPDQRAVTSLTTVDLSSKSSHDTLQNAPSSCSLLMPSCQSLGQLDSQSVDNHNAKCHDTMGNFPSLPLEELAPESPISTGRRANLRSKPPNVLIYCGKKDSARLFEAVKDVICQCINTDRYTIYHLKHGDVATTPWCDNAALLVVASDKVYDGVDQQFLNYFVTGGGTLMCFGSTLDSLIVRRETRLAATTGLGVLTLRCGGQQGLAVICGRYCYCEEEAMLSGRSLVQALIPDVVLACAGRDEKTEQCVIVEAVHKVSGGVALLSQVHLDKDPVEMAFSNDVFTMLKKSNTGRFQVLTTLLTRLGLECDKAAAPPLSPIILLTKSQDKRLSFFNSFRPRLHDNCLVSKDLTLNFLPATVAIDSDSLPPVTVSSVAVVTNESEVTVSTLRFDSATYWRNLTAKVLGSVVLVANVMTTTMNVFDSLMFSCPAEVGLIAIAHQQVAGQGRGGNAWLSPAGCAMFSLHVQVPLKSNLGEHVTYLQHLMALAVVLAVRSKPRCQSIDLRIKWPNDIYYGREIKLGGVIVKSSIMHNVIHANIGCGVNVTNKDPTMCINDLVGQVAVGSQPDPFTVEEVIARSVSILEELIADFQTNGRHSFLDQYYKYWLHSGSSVSLGTDGTQGDIVGLDDFGFLLVRRRDGSTVSVQPDGNSFDMMKNLIVPKAR